MWECRTWTAVKAECPLPSGGGDAGAGLSLVSWGALPGLGTWGHCTLAPSLLKFLRALFLFILYLLISPLSSCFEEG